MIVKLLKKDIIGLVLIVECYLYPTLFTALIHLIKPELIRWDKIKLGLRSNRVVSVCVATIRHRVSYKIFINKQIKYKCMQ